MLFANPLFCKIFKYNKVFMILQNYWLMAMIEVIRDVDGVGRGHMVILISAPEAFYFGYVYIHENALSDAGGTLRDCH